MTYAIFTLAAIGLIQAVLLARTIGGLRRLDRFETRLGHLADAMDLLTETTESGFRASATEIGRIAERPVTPAARSRTTTRRVATAARRGKSVAEIAADEQVSEGEVRLRLHLADPAGAAGRRSAGPAKKEHDGGALRA